MKIKLLCLIMCLLFLAACQGSKPIPTDCLKLLATHQKVIDRMKASGRFADDFMEKHETQWRMMEFLATSLGRSRNEEKRQQEIERCRKAYIIVEPQLELSKRIAVIPESELEQRFSPPLGFNRKPQ